MEQNKTKESFFFKLETYLHGAGYLSLSVKKKMGKEKGKQ